MNTLISGVIGIIMGIVGGYYAASPTEELNITPEPTKADVQTPIAEDFLSLRSGLEAYSIEDITNEEQQDLLFMREEEKLARDVYVTLYEKWGLPIFNNIAQSEQTHTESVRQLLIKYNIPDPVTEDAVGVFVNEDLKILYEELINEGLVSEVAALRVGAKIEELDIKDIQSAIVRTDNEDIKMVYENLLRGSRNHLRSFVGTLRKRNEVYDPLYITVEQLSSIVDTERERGQMRGWGKQKMN